MYEQDGVGDPIAAEDRERLNRDVKAYEHSSLVIGSQNMEIAGAGSWQPRSGDRQAGTGTEMVLKNGTGATVRHAYILTADVARAISELGWETA